MINLANPESLLGMLQRGRGKGFLAALEAAPEAVWPLLFECITHDPRIDSQCEDRAEYYCGLITATGMDLKPLQHHLRQNDAHDVDSDLWPSLTLETLTRMAQRGSLEAVHILRDYVSYGQAWVEVLYTLAHLDMPEVFGQAAAEVCSRARNDAAVHAQFEDEVRKSWRTYCYTDEDTRARPDYWFLPIHEPWKSICARNTELADLFRSIGIDYDQPPPPDKPSKEYLAGLSLKDMFTLVDESNRTLFRRILPGKVSASDEDYLLEQFATGNPAQMILALQGLGKLGTPRAYEAVRTLIEDRADISHYVRVRGIDAMAQMPGWLTLETARQWFRRQEFNLHLAGGEILARHATREDVPLLIEALHTPETHQGDDCRFHNALEALARIKGLGSVPELEQIFCQTDYSWSRYRAAKAMAATAPAEFTSRYAFECLWDCHWGARRVGCSVVNLSTPRALDRVREIAADKDDGAQEAAAQRLKESML